MAAKTEVKPFEIWPENWKAFEVFLRLQSQWNVGAMGGFLGLDYASVPFLFKIYNIEDERETFESIQTLEFAALEVLNEKRD